MYSVCIRCVCAAGAVCAYAAHVMEGVRVMEIWIWRVMIAWNKWAVQVPDQAYGWGIGHRRWFFGYLYYRQVEDDGRIDD